MRRWMLSETNLAELRKRMPEVAVIPAGATEPHNYHLPQGQDHLHTAYVAEECCRIAWEKTGAVICLPVIPYGVDRNLQDFPLAMHVSQSVLDALIADLVGSLVHYRIHKILIVNGHGGNDFTPLVRRLQADGGAHLFLCDWWTVGGDVYGEIFSMADDHAGEMETSVAMAIHPELVNDPAAAGNGRVRPFRFEALQRGWVYTSRRFSRLNDHCAAGDPAAASADKGRRYLDVIIERISAFLIDLANAKIDDCFPHLSDD
ncbi:creatininase family protein [bacterium]|nr:creatininase family protein [bacterium]